MKIYVVTYMTESGDEGVLGAYTAKPSDCDLRERFEEDFPEEFPDGECCVYWETHCVDLTENRHHGDLLET